MTSAPVSRVRTQVGGLGFDLAVTAVASTVLMLVAVAPVLDRLKVAWGAGDLISHYVNVDLWRGFGYQASTHYGFPGGMDQNLFPGLDITQNSIAALLSRIFGDPFIGLNLLALLSFPLTAVLAVVAFRLVGMTGWWAIALSLSYTFLPYHWGRLLGHTYLGTMYAAVTGVILALIIGQGRLSIGKTTHKIWLITGVLVIITAWSNVYYAAFGLLLMASALLFRILQGDGWHSLLRSTIPFLATFTGVLIGFIPSLIARASEPGVVQLGSRFAYDSVSLAGNLSMLLLPAPVSQLPYMGYYNAAARGLIEEAPALENVSETNFGTWIILFGLLFLLVWWIMRKRSGRHTPRDLQLLVLLIVVMLLFFIPWGLNALFAEFISAQIRAWNRLVPTLAMLILLSVAVAVRRSSLMRPPWRWLIPTLVALVVLVEQVIPYRAVYVRTIDVYEENTMWAKEYAQASNAVLPDACAVAQFPSMAYPENGTIKPELIDYEHFWHSLLNRERDFSYGAVRMSEAGELLAEVDLPLSSRDVKQLRELGFCAVHVDLRGIRKPNRAEALKDLQLQLGRPIATGREGDWLLYAID